MSELKEKKRKMSIIIRFIFGVFLLFFGFNHFFNYIPFPEMTTEANTYFENLSSTGAMQLVGLVEIASAFAFILNKYGALMASILMSVSVNAVLFHIALDPDKIFGALTLIGFNIVMLYIYRRQYVDLLKV